MNKVQELHELGQSLWLDNITREILDDGIRDNAKTGSVEETRKWTRVLRKAASS